METISNKTVYYFQLECRSQGQVSRSESTMMSAELKIQLKATINLDLNLETNVFSFPLEQKNYDELRIRSLVPRILVVLSLPANPDEWITHSEDYLTVKNCAYWVSLLGLPASGNTTNTTVYIPKANVLSPDSIKELLIKVSKEEAL